MSEVIVNVLGTAQDAGVPHPNCFCENCTQAHNDARYKRLAASLAIVLPEQRKWHLIDATPDLKEQMARLQMKYGMESVLMDSIFLSHAHMGHYPGLLFLGREAIGAKDVPVMAGSKMKQLLEEQAPWKQLTSLGNIDVKDKRDGEVVQIAPQVNVTFIEVPHRNEFSETFAFLIEGPTKKLLYVPDIDRWEQWEHELHNICEDVDICLLDGTFYSPQDLEKIGRDYREIPHPVITETMERLKDLAEHKEIYFTHLNHSNPAIHTDNIVRDMIEAKGFHIAEEDMEFRL